MAKFRWTANSHNPIGRTSSQWEGTAEADDAEQAREKVKAFVQRKSGVYNTVEAEVTED
ncbi:hypothetical protein GA0115240_137830 [Streptomyces sp. DvalAA-14]|uniref:hypothetical protein n=1 Tax=unclassified Streptomyces TaxID=2593676 RepID=UPI00081B69E1|nr:MULTISPECIES: hypothetical protein [unclassified Streptomyces]MYS22066.1 hypothetical protein [Streptomyces sp. SID4948]SCE07814.1 hypothetical protein GA0115240_137830 [Streptomyces sp. DvalAA-14]